MTTTTYDPVEVEIHRRALESITREAAITLTRTSGSPVIYEVRDFATSLLDPSCEQLSLSITVLLHSGSSLFGTRAVIDSLPEGHELRPGDGWMVNDPFTGGAAHQGDVGVIMPLFYGDDDHVGWAFSNVHVLDVGGSGVSGFAPGATSVFEEGIRFPPTQVIRGGVIDPNWETFIGANVRIADLVLNDMRSMIAANNVSQQKLTTTIDRYGLERFREYCEINKSLTESAFRARIEQLPDGVYETAEWIEFDGHGEDQLLQLDCRMEVDGSDINLQFNGDPQINAFVNGTPGLVHGSVMATLLTTLAYGDLPFNAGMWRPLTIDLGPAGTIVNAVPPVPVSAGHSVVGTRVTLAVKELLNQACALSSDETLRSRVGGQGWDAAGLAPLAGLGHGDQPTVIFFMDQVTAIGGGAQTGFDGMDGYGWTITPGVGLPSVETNEGQQPVSYLWRKMIENSGGPGIRRGGQSMESTYAIYDSEVMSGAMTLFSAEVPPHGAGGALPGASGSWDSYHQTNVLSLYGEGRQPLEPALEGRSERQPSNVGRIAFATGDVIRMRGGGGGGLGDPILRPPELVGADVRDDFISVEHADAAYGVICSPDGDVDSEATERQRAEIRRNRIGSDPKAAQKAPEMPGISIVAAAKDGGDRWSCAYCDGDLGAVADNWRQTAVTSEHPIAERFADLQMRVRERAEEDGPVRIAEHFCPDCAGLVGVDVYPRDFPGFAAPRLSHGVS